MPFKHHAIAVTSWSDEYIKAAHLKAVEIFGNTVSGIIRGKINSYQSFFIAPDGSYEERSESNIGDNDRKLFIEYINSKSFGYSEDGEYEGNPLSFAEFYYGDDEFGKSEITNHN